MGEAPLEVATDGAVIAQHVARADEKILKGERAIAPSLSRKRRSGGTQNIESDAVHVLAPALERGTHLVGDGFGVLIEEALGHLAVGPALLHRFVLRVIAFIEECELLEGIVEVSAAPLPEQLPDHRLERVRLIAVGVRRQIGLDLVDQFAQRVADAAQVRPGAPLRHQDDVWVLDDALERTAQRLAIEANLERFNKQRIAGKALLLVPAIPETRGDLLCGSLIQLFELRIEAGFYRTFAQEARAESMCGPDEAAIDFLERGPHARSGVAFIPSQRSPGEA